MRNRKRLRLLDYNYKSQGIYFITIVTKNREHYFGRVENQSIILNEYGNIVKQCWLEIEKFYKNIEIMEFIIMPNHFHGLIQFFENATYSLSQIVASLKSFSSRRINEAQENFYFQWQKSFHDHIVRNDEELVLIKEYIINNQLKWNDDEYFSKS